MYDVAAGHGMMKELPMRPAQEIVPGISGTGYYVPETIVSNEDIAKSVTNYDAQRAGTSLDAWIRRRYGIAERRISHDEAASYQAYRAAQEALADAGLAPQDIDFLVLNTSSGDYIQPTTASIVQGLLGMRKDTFAMEINLPCGGPMFGISTAASFIMSGKYRHGLVIGVDKMFQIIDTRDFKMAGLFGEGAGAVVVSRGGRHPILDFHLSSAPEQGEESDFALGIVAGGSRHPASAATVAAEAHYLRMNGPKVESFAIDAITQSVGILVEAAGLTVQDIGFFVSHQAAWPMISRAYSQLGAPADKVLFTIDKFGNTSAASVLITLAYHKQLYQKGQKIILTAMGAGLNWGGILLEW